MLTSLVELSLIVVIVVAVALLFGLRIRRAEGSQSPLVNFWSWRGEVSRGQYAAVGVIGFALKHNLDRAIATLGFHRPFNVFNYWIPPVQALRISSLSSADAAFLVTMVVVSLPFIWVGLAMTLRRLRSAGLPLWLVFLFFIPILNVFFFVVLSLIPEARPIVEPQQSGSRNNPLIPSSILGSAAVAVIAMSAIGTPLIYVGVQSIGTYGWSVFVALPFCLGFGAVMIYGYQRPRSLGSCILVSLLAVFLAAVGLFAFAVEGLVCILMALPIAAPLALLGGLVGFLIQRDRSLPSQLPSSFTLIVALVPLNLMNVESEMLKQPTLHVVTTSIRIDAPASRVWPHLIAFPDLPEPDYWLFRLGVSHPIRANIDGEGVGAMRECLFSTGTFVERIDIWEKDKRLAFSVVSAADAMREFSPYNIHPRHLDGYFNPERAEFTLLTNPDGTTTLEGKSWYRNAMWPGMYWRLWSDQILHNVHRSVFVHVKRLSERE